MKDFFLLAFNNLKRRKIRSWLTMIGIFIGIAAVVALISLGQGLQDYISEEFEKLGSDKIIIMSNTFGPPGSASGDLILTSQDLKVIEDVKGVKWAIGFLTKQGLVSFKDETAIIYTNGMDPEDTDLLSEIQSWDIEEGRFLKKGDKYKAVVGYDHAYGDLWEKPLELGSQIEIQGVEFEVVGIVIKIGNSIDDQQVFVPKESLKELLGIEDEETQILAKTAESYNPEEVAETIERRLRQSRDEKEGEETFSVSTSEQLLETFSNIFGVVQAVFVGIAAISLLVGGIGIMNTMYTAVLERTKEIGTMKAIGAKNSDIATLFLLESGLLGMVGGLIGVIIGASLAKGTEFAATQALGTPLVQASLPWWLIIGALLFSFIIGSLSGLLPAMQASRLKPADALRYE